MGERPILVFKTLEAAQSCLSVIDQIITSDWAEKGYDIDVKNEKSYVIQKGSEKGNPKGTPLMWDVVKESPDGRFYFADPSRKPRYAGWLVKAESLQYRFDGEVMPFPEEWIITPDNV